LRESDLAHSFRPHPSAIFATGFLALMAITAFLASLITPQNPYDCSALLLWNSEIPPIWGAQGQ
jgi:peptide/nickel transport system permease protein